MSQQKYTGVYNSTLKDGTLSFRASITFNGKHIALGSFNDAKKASSVYQEAADVLRNTDYMIGSYSSSMNLPFEKYVSLINYRDKGMYIANPIYLEKKYFFY